MTDVTWGIELTPEHPIREVGRLAAAAEEAGFDTAFVSSHYNNRDPFLALAEVVRDTDAIRLGPGVVNPYETHPVALASRVATLQERSDGRAVFGVGAGDRSTLRNLGIDRDRPLRRVLETVRVAKRLWAGERVDHDGTFRADAELNYEPPGEIPAYVGAQGPDMLRMAAKHADGILFNGSHERDVAWAAERVAEGRDDRPDAREDVDFAVYASVSVANDTDAAREAARAPVAFIAAGAAPPVLERHGLDASLAEEVGAAIEAGEFTEAFGLVSEEMVDAFCIAGTPETVADRVAGVLEHADGIVFGSPLGPELGEAIGLAGVARRTCLERGPR